MSPFTIRAPRTLVALAAAGLFAANGAFALELVTMPAPAASVDQCVAEIASHADYGNAGRVRHDVDSKNWRAIGHKITVRTSVFDADSSEMIRAYSTVCAVSDDAELKRFKITEKSS